MLVCLLVVAPRLVDYSVGLSLPGLHICYGDVPLLKAVEGASL